MALNHVRYTVKRLSRTTATAHRNSNMARYSAKALAHLRPLGLLLSFGFLVSCEMSIETGYIHADEPIGTVREVYDGALYPDIQVNTFRNIDRLFPTRVVKRGPDVYPLPVGGTPLENFRFVSRGQEYDLYDFVSLNRVSGLLVIKNGNIIFERYFLGNNEATHWMSMSVVKSMTATLVGAAIKDGYIKSIDDRVTDYLPRFIGSAYDGVTLRQLLQMASGVAWNETYTDPKSDRRRMLDAQIGQKPGEILDLMAELPRAAEPGTRWNYSTGETHVVGALVRAATGMPVADYLSTKIWARFGMECDASWWLESPDGLEVGGSGLSATLRDYGRFGLFLLHDGVIGGESILPDGWIRASSTPSIINGEETEYGYMLWPLGDNTYAAIGIFGQFIYVNPDKNIVVAMWGAQAKPVGRDVVDEYEFFDALSEAVP
jgi:CubicO group peptidase (beta-lactamase class C family)